MDMGDRIYLILTFITAPVSIIIMGWVTWWFIQQRGEKEDTERVGSIWAKRTEWGEALCRQLINREIAVEMTPEMVRLAWGQPQAIQRPPDTDIENWLYDSDQLETAQQYVTLKNGQVIGWHGQPQPTTQGIDPWVVIVGLIGFAFFISTIVLIVVLATGG